MALRFNTAFRHDNGMLERRRSVIAARYCRGSFLFDLLATVPLVPFCAPDSRTSKNEPKPKPHAHPQVASKRCYS